MFVQIVTVQFSDPIFVSMLWLNLIHCSNLNKVRTRIKGILSALSRILLRKTFRNIVTTPEWDLTSQSVASRHFVRFIDTSLIPFYFWVERDKNGNSLQQKNDLNNQINFKCSIRDSPGLVWFASLRPFISLGNSHYLLKQSNKTSTNCILLFAFSRALGSMFVLL